LKGVNDNVETLADLMRAFVEKASSPIICTTPNSRLAVAFSGGIGTAWR